MSFADSFERRFLFVLTRGLALLFIFGLLAAIVIGGVIVSEMYAGVAFGAILLIALFSLILVLLAIERNTRRGQA